jgi:hypothetical protein
LNLHALPRNPLESNVEETLVTDRLPEHIVALGDRGWSAQFSRDHASDLGFDA